MKEYKIVRIKIKAKDTEIALNKLAEKGWNLVCSYAQENEWLIFERSKKVLSKEEKGGKK